MVQSARLHSPIDNNHIVSSTRPQHEMAIANVVLFANEDAGPGVSRVAVFRRVRQNQYVIGLSSRRAAFLRGLTSALVLSSCDGIWWLRQHKLHATNITALRRHDQDVSRILIENQAAWQSTLGLDAHGLGRRLRHGGT